MDANCKNYNQTTEPNGPICEKCHHDRFPNKTIREEIEGEFVKKQQCKKATRVCKLNSFSVKTQRWKLDGPMLKNKEEVIKKSKK